MTTTATLMVPMKSDSFGDSVATNRDRLGGDGHSVAGVQAASCPGMGWIFSRIVRAAVAVAGRR
ncbi:MAG: hypothetical protein L0H25_10115 [Micrococcales bacterium]|nr:hypothetical protein [Micrococcales bacterium]